MLQLVGYLASYLFEKIVFWLNQLFLFNFHFGEQYSGPVSFFDHFSRSLFSCSLVLFLPLASSVGVNQAPHNKDISLVLINYQVVIDKRHHIYA